MRTADVLCVVAVVTKVLAIVFVVASRICSAHSERAQREVLVGYVYLVSLVWRTNLGKVRVCAYEMIFM